MAAPDGAVLEKTTDVETEEGAETAREGQLRIAKWLGIDLTGLTAVQVDHAIYTAAIPKAMLSDAEALGIDVTGGTYGSAKEHVQKGRLTWSREKLKEKGPKAWAVGTLLWWDENDGSAPTEKIPDLTPGLRLWVITNILPDKGRVTVKPLDSGQMVIDETREKAIVSLVFHPVSSIFRSVLAFRLRDAPVANPADLRLF